MLEIEAVQPVDARNGEFSGSGFVVRGRVNTFAVFFGFASVKDAETARRTLLEAMSKCVYATVALSQEG